MKTSTGPQPPETSLHQMPPIQHRFHLSKEDMKQPSFTLDNPISPLTGSTNTIVLETFPTSLLIECYQRDLGLDVSPEFLGIERLQLCRCLTSDLMFFTPAVTGSPEFYRHLEQFDWYFPPTKFEYDQASSWIQPNHRVLDIGCGDGRFAQRISPASYTGLDPNPISSIEPEHIDSRILNETIAEHAMKNVQAYDVVCAFQVLEHVAKPREFLYQVLHCLKPEGLLILGVPSAESYVTNIPNFVLNAPPHHVTWWTDHALYSLAELFHLSVMDMVHAPVESWETRLFWMQRINQLFLPMKVAHFTEKRLHRFSNVASYIGARFIMPFAHPPSSAKGSTVVLVTRKKEDSFC